MTETLMADIGKELITVRMVSESNAVTYKLNVGIPSAGNAKLPYLKLNDTDLQPQASLTPSAGLNIRGFAVPTAIAESKYFTLTTSEGSVNDGFIEYMDSSQHKLMILYSGKGLKSSPRVDAWFASKGSVNWPGSVRFARFNYTYIALYSPSRKKILAEVYHGEDNPTNTGFCTMEKVFDTFDDLGSTGFPYKSVYDPAEHVVTTEYEFKRYPEGVGLVAKMNDFGISPGAKMMLSGELFQSKELVAAGQTARVNLRWYKGTTLKDSLSVDVPSNEVDKWYKIKDTYSIAPLDADGFTIVAARYPRNDATVAKSGIRNVVFSEVAREDSISSPASIGVNGIKVNNIIEGTTGNLLMQLPDTEMYPNNSVPVVNLKELELEY